MMEYRAGIRSKVKRLVIRASVGASLVELDEIVIAAQG